MHTQQNIFLLCVLLFLSFPVFFSAQEAPHSFIVEFSRTTDLSGKKEIISGVAYYRSNPPLFCVELTAPISQKIFYSAKSTLIYYPLENRALKIEYTSNQEIAMQKELLVLFLKDKGLEQSGYTLSKIDFLESGLQSVWLPPKNLSKSIGSLKVTTNTAEKIQSMLTEGVAGKKMQLTEYSEYLSLHPFVPRLSRTTLYTPDSLVLMELTLRIEKLEINTSLPDQIVRFTLPENIFLEVMEW